MTHVEALQLIEKVGGRVWLGEPPREEHYVSVDGVTIKATIWERLLELGDLELEENGNYALLAEAGRLRILDQCRIEPCDGKVVARRLCKKHYSRWRRHGNTEQLSLSNTEYRARHQMDPVDDGFWDQVVRCQKDRLRV